MDFILGYASNLCLQDVLVFVKSARRHMPSDDMKIILWVEENELSSYSILSDYGVTLNTLKTRIKQKPSSTLHKLWWNSKSLAMFKLETLVDATPQGRIRAFKRWGNQGFIRRLHFREYLEEHPEIDRVFLSDVRDVFFQANIFEKDLVNDKLYIARDFGRLSDSAMVMRWLRIFWGPMAAKKLAHKPLYCSGTILGYRQPMLDFLHFYEQALLKKSFFLWGLDTSIFLDYIFNVVGEEGCVSMDNTNGNLVVTAPQNIHSYPQLNANGEPFACVHMYDRNPVIWNLVRKEFGVAQ